MFLTNLGASLILLGALSPGSGVTAKFHGVFGRADLGFALVERESAEVSALNGQLPSGQELCTSTVHAWVCFS